MYSYVILIVLDDGSCMQGRQCKDLLFNQNNITLSVLAADLILSRKNAPRCVAELGSFQVDGYFAWSRPHDKAENFTWRDLNVKMTDALFFPSEFPPAELH